MKYEVEFHPSAGDEVVAIKRWYLERSEDAAARFEEELRQVVVGLEEYPMRWRERSAGVRQHVMHRFPFLVVYRVKQAIVEVVAVAHGRRRPGYWKSRLGI